MKRKVFYLGLGMLLMGMPCASKMCVCYGAENQQAMKEKQITKTDQVPDETDPEKRLVGLSISCEKPAGKKDYLTDARKIVAMWLDSLKNETGKYKLTSYTFTDELDDSRVFQGDGDIGGGREFVCYVAFDTDIEDEESVFYSNGSYDTFYHYYFGPGVYARFRWEDGKCTLIDYDEAFAMQVSKRLKSGLYGINKSKYKTFFDFMNDKENEKQWLGKPLRSQLYDMRYSHNVMMLSSGEVFFVDIGSEYDEIKGQDKDHVTAEMGDYFYTSTGEERYSSPVDFIDDIGSVTMTYRKNFPLIFGDYNHDGNPDYTIRVASDKKGSTYRINCIDAGGNPWEDQGKIYIYGEFAESVRLQVADTGKLLNLAYDDKGKAVYNELGMLSDLSETTHERVTDEPAIAYRMYSQKFYLPENLRVYDQNDKKIICYFWNNTPSKVSVGGKYEIQRKGKEGWVTVSKGKSIQPIKVEGRGCAELTFDISDLTKEEVSLYRIKMRVGNKQVYGGFYKENKKVSTKE